MAFNAMAELARPGSKFSVQPSIERRCTTYSMGALYLCTYLAKLTWSATVAFGQLLPISQGRLGTSFWFTTSRTLATHDVMGCSSIVSLLYPRAPSHGRVVALLLASFSRSIT